MANALPTNKQAEAYLISAALGNEANAKFIVNELNEFDFTDYSLKEIFKVFVSLYENKMSLDISTVGAVLENNGVLSKIGGVNFLSKLLDQYLTDEGVEETAKILRDKTNARELLNTFHDLETKYFSKSFDDDNSFLGNSEAEINAITANRRVSGFRNLKEISNVIRNNIEISKHSSSSLVGLDTGYPLLNKITLGFNKGEVIVIAARPSVGKTAFGVNIAYNVASRSMTPVLIFSVEMSPEALGTRILASVSNVDLSKILTGNVNDKDMVKIGEGIKQMEKTPIFIDPTPNIKIGELVTKSRKFKAENPNLSMILIDYLGLITTDKKYESNRIQVGAISHELKALAKELSIPVVVISQLSRGVESRTNKRPEMSDLRDSGDIEQDADKILLLYRDDYYDKKSNKEPGSAEATFAPADRERERIKEEIGDVLTSTVEINVAKNRNGQTSTTYLLFFKNLSRFDTPTDDFIDNYKKTKTY
ncbi:MAG: replicative DNA helicase [Bacilli bacterium]